MESREEDLCAAQLEALGRIMASFTHELKNHLAIINESNGLLMDLLDMVRLCDEPLALRLDKITASTKKRLAMAAEMAQILNGLAHRMDTPLATFAVNELIREELAFVNRFAHLKMVKVDTSFGEGVPAIHNNPALCQFILFKMFTAALARTEAHELLTISTEAVGDSCRVIMAVPDGGATEAEDLTLDDAFDSALHKAGASFQLVTEPGKNRSLVLQLSSLALSP